MRNRIGGRRVGVGALALLMAGLCLLCLNGSRDHAALAPARLADQTLIIDAGHGGEDGGAVSITGVPESGINLAIALKMDQILGFYGTAPVLLRSEDISLHDPSAQTLRQKKVSDLHHRVEVIESIPNATLISIHQNSYPSAKYHGAQVFYSNEALSLPLAQRTQTLLRDTLDPSNQRVPKPIPETVYLMNHISCRAILVECGFLTNAEEEVRLRTGEYQSKLAAVLAAAWLQQSADKEVVPHNEIQNTVLLYGLRQ